MDMESNTLGTPNGEKILLNKARILFETDALVRSFFLKDT